MADQTSPGAAWLQNPPRCRHDRVEVDIDDITNPHDLENLPILHTIVMETLRLWPSVPGEQPRVVPKKCSLGGYADIPAGTIVQSYAHVLHHTPTAFPDPWQWKPERWLDADKESLALMKRWFWGFGSGPRGCLGSHFAFFCNFLRNHVVVRLLNNCVHLSTSYG